MLILALLAYFGLQAWVNHRATQAVERQLALLPGAVQVEYDSIRVSLFRRTAYVDGLAIRLSPQEPPFRIASLVIHRIDRDNPVPHELMLELRGIEKNLVESSLPYAAWLRRHGYDRLAGSAVRHYRYLPDRRRLELERFSTGFDEIGELELRGSWPQVVPEGVPLMDWRIVDSVALDSFQATYHDEGLVRRVLGRAAAGQGMRPETLAANILAEMEWSAAAFDDERLDASVRALRLFLAGAETIRLELEPDEPRPLGQLRDTVMVDPPRAALDVRLLMLLPVDRPRLDGMAD
ncbi:MAG: hypothetical protein LAT50_15405 [Ectothiorhodospiraceae bacterium]|nr:hypothetical protein [Ectothiorhodospiraceae bacterium]